MSPTLSPFSFVDLSHGSTSFRRKTFVRQTFARLSIWPTHSLNYFTFVRHTYNSIIWPTVDRRIFIPNVCRPNVCRPKVCRPNVIRPKASEPFQLKRKIGQSEKRNDRQIILCPWAVTTFLLMTFVRMTARLCNNIAPSSLLATVCNTRINGFLPKSQTVACTIIILRSSYNDHHEWCLYYNCVVALPLALAFALPLAGIINYAPRVMLQIVASLTDDTRGVIYNHKMYWDLPKSQPVCKPDQNIKLAKRNCWLYGSWSFLPVSVIAIHLNMHVWLKCYFEKIVGQVTFGQKL